MSGRSENLVILLGKIATEPKYKQFLGGGAVASFRVATTRKWIDKTSNKQCEKTIFHTVVAKNKLAEIVYKIFKKGAECYVRGYTDHRSYIHKEFKIEIFVTEVIAQEAVLTGNLNVPTNNDAPAVKPGPL